MKLIEVKVNTNKGSFRFYRKNGLYYIDTKSSAECNKANVEIVKELQKLSVGKVRIVSGKRSRKKRIELENELEPENS